MSERAGPAARRRVGFTRPDLLSSGVCQSPEDLEETNKAILVHIENYVKSYFNILS